MNYIKKLTVKNFFSIKNEVSIDFKASEYTIENHPYRVFKRENESINKLKVFYGANASGKTSLLRSLVYISYVISNKTDTFVNGFKNIYNPRTKSFIEIEFHFKGRDYLYRVDFLASGTSIIGIANEILKQITTKELVLINREKEIFKNLLQEDIEGILFDKVPSTKSLLVESLTRTEDYENLVSFFRDIVFLTNIRGTHNIRMQFDPVDDGFAVAGVFSNQSEQQLIKKEFDNLDKDEFRNFLFPFLKNLGLDIIDANSIITKEKEKPKINFKTRHNIDGSKELDFKLESNGTKMLFKILFDIFYAYKKNTILVIDELDSILHPMLVPAINLLAIKNNVQLIYTTHNIFNMKYLYNDEIQIIEKNIEHDTIIKDTKEFAGYENFAKLYEENELGGLPHIVNLDFDFKVASK